MTSKPDDFDAVRVVVQTLEPFEEEDRRRIIRWACEKLKIAAPDLSIKRPAASLVEPKEEAGTAMPATSSAKEKDIGTFVADKAPKNDKQFCAVVAYYYRFEAPESERKESISATDVQDACRLTKRARLKYPAQTLVNAFKAGYLDKSEYGKYRLNTVGENLVAMVLPASESETQKRQSRTRVRRQSRRKPRKH